MRQYRDRVNEVKVALEACLKELAGDDPVVGPQFQLAVAALDLVRHDPGACASTRDLAADALDKIEKAMADAMKRAAAKAAPTKTIRNGQRHRRAAV